MKTNFKLISTNRINQINCLLWIPASTEEPCGIIQIIHGMAEHIERYDEFANFLTAQGYLVVGHDHLGHGYSVDPQEPQYGYFTKNESPTIVVEDAYQLTRYAQNLYPTLPYFVLGHSMGSFTLRNYLKKYSQDLAGAIIMGTGGYHAELNLILPFVSLLNRTAPQKINHLIDKVAFGNFAKTFPEKNSNMDWLSKNPANVTDYLADPLLGFIFTNNGFYTLFNLMAQATKKNWFKTIKRELPLLIISGEQDPVGNFGKAPRQIAQTLETAQFNDVTLQLYPELRHEILNEVEKELVMTDILHWLAKH